MNIWFTSDTHYGHRNICRAESTWKDRLHQTRDFASLVEMDDTIVNNINKYVKEDDILYHSGDWSMGNKANIKIFRDRLKCKTIHLILGNHDKHIAKDPELQKLFASVSTSFGFPDVGKSKIGGTRFIISHFPMFVWDKHMHGSIHLHGHCHGTLNMPGMNERKILDIGIDNHPEFRPFHIEEIRKMMSSREIFEVDHHTKNTPE